MVNMLTTPAVLSLPLEESYYIAISIEIDMTFEGYEGRERILVSYDVSGEARSTAARVCQMVFGRMRIVRRSQTMREERGFIHRPGVVWVGQSVLAMPPRDAEELGRRLRSLGVRVATARIDVSSEALEAFRRPK